MNKEMTLPEMQLADMPCVFCGASSHKVDGGFFKNKFLCNKCDGELHAINFFLGRDKK